MTTVTLSAPMSEPGLFARPDQGGSMPATTRNKLDDALLALQSGKEAWVQMDLAERLALLEELVAGVCGVRDWWWSLCVDAKGVRGDVIGEAEEWASLAHVFRLIGLLSASLRDIQRYGRPQIPGPLYARPDGQVVAQVYPARRYDRLVFQRTTAEVWMEPGISAGDVLQSQAGFYQDEQAAGRVCLVLAPGNTSMGPPSDVLYKLFVEGRVVLLKMNPVNDYLGPLLCQAFRPLVERDFLRVVYGGAGVGDYLCHHPLVDELHITGSNRTYETILFGSGAEGERRKAEGRPLLAKRFTGELGTVAPVIILPGPWRAEEITAQAERLVLWLTTNAGFNCVTPRVLVQWAGWDQRLALNEAISRALARVPQRAAYYPGAGERQARFVAAHPQAQAYGAPGDGRLPWTFIPGVDPGDRDNICFRNEAFCGLLAETALDAPDIFTYLEEAVQFANETLWGNLAATLIVHPKCLKKRHVATAVDRAVAALRNGIVTVNQFAGFAYLTGTITWGAFPGNDCHDIQSGFGVTGNPLMFAHPQKAVVRGPFSLPLDPLSLNSRTAHEVCRRLADVQCRPSLPHAAGLLWSAVQR
jgi:acyl-CoA reductase-like NAD-dependent aldehyde dehydrogenase